MITGHETTPEEVSAGTDLSGSDPAIICSADHNKTKGTIRYKTTGSKTGVHTDVQLVDTDTGETWEVQLKATDSSAYAHEWIDSHPVARFW